MQFVIWGNGYLGKLAVEFLGDYEIVCIIEKNKTLQGTYYKKIPIISPEDFLQSEWKNCPVLVTPKDYEGEIINCLTANGILLAFSFSREYSIITAYTMQLRQFNSLPLFFLNKGLCLYGLNFAALLVVADFEKNSITFRFLLDDKQYEAFADCLKKSVSADVSVERFNSAAEVDKIIFAINPSDSINKSLAIAERFNLFNVSMNKSLFRNRDLEKFKNCHKGSRCFIIGNGPSLRTFDLETLYKNGDICFATNGIIKAFDKTHWRPDYYCLSDPIAYLLYESELLKNETVAKELFFADVVCHFDFNHYPNNCHFCHLFLNSEDDIFFSDDFSCGGYWGRTVVYDICLQLAVYMGCTEIYLLGCDCSFGKNGEKHFIKGYDQEGKEDLIRESHFPKFIHSYEIAKSYADSHGIRIYNATRGGALEVFPRVDFDSLFD